MAMRDYRLMALFVAIADAGSVRAAARRLDLSPAVVSAALADLEAALGTTLMRRTRGRLELTADGAAFHATAREMVRAADAAMAMFRAGSARPRGRLGITLPTELCVAWLPPILKAFEARHPDVRMEVEATDVAIDLARSPHDLAIRARFVLRAEDEPSAFAHLPISLFGPPALARRFGARSPAAGDTLPLIGFSERSNRASVPAIAPDGRNVELAAAMRMRVNSGVLARDLACQGLGVALLIEAGAAADLTARRLVRLLPGYRFGFVALRALMRDAQPSPAARAFAAFVEAAGRAPPLVPTPARGRRA